MKLRNKFKFASAALAAVALSGVTSCNYLDVVPPEQPGLSDAMKNYNNAEGFLYSCYNKMDIRDMAVRDYRGCLNCSNDEFLVPEGWLDIEGRTGYDIMRNTQQANDAGGYDPHFWDQYYAGVGQTLLFERELDGEGKKNDVWKGNEATYKRWKAEARFCRAYYHFQLLRLYGPIPITTSFIDQDAPISSYPGRVHFDGVVKWLNNEFEQVAQDLLDAGIYWEDAEGEYKPELPSLEYNRATPTICYALQSRLNLLAASDLWNGKFPYKAWRNKVNSSVTVNGETTNYGKELFAQDFDETKWQDALYYTLRAIHIAELSGHRLFTTEDADELDKEEVFSEKIFVPLLNDPLDAGSINADDKKDFILKMQAISPVWGENQEPFTLDDYLNHIRMLRYLNTTTYDEGNHEIIWATNSTGWPGDAGKYAVYGSRSSRLPRRVLLAESDKKWREGWNGVSPTLYTVEHFLNANGLTPGLDSYFNSRDDYYTDKVVPSTLRKHVIKLDLYREPRYYAWIAFDGGDYLTRLHDGDPFTLDMRDPEKQGRGQGERNYSVTGFLSMKHVDPSSKWSADGNFTDGNSSPEVIFRMAELYLNAAECFAEMAERGIPIPDNAKEYFEAECPQDAQGAAIYYVNKIRNRAYVAPLKSEMIGSTDNEGKVWTLVRWVRNERFIELWDEGVRFFDVRRWVAGEEYFGFAKRSGLNGLKVAPSDAEFLTPMMVNSQYTFHKRQYIWPVYQSEVYNNPNMTQAPAY